MGWEWRISGEQAEQAQRPCSRNASGEAEGQEEATMDGGGREREDGWRLKLAGFVVRSDLKQ